MTHLSKVLLAVALTLPAVTIGAETGVKPDKSATKTYKISDIYKNKDPLNKQQVTVKGKVVKVSSGIMDKNWFHIQDGSGKENSKNNDLTVTTTQAAPSVGKTVTVSGTVYKDKDFGAGYFYNVIVEQATYR